MSLLPYWSFLTFLLLGLISSSSKYHSWECVFNNFSLTNVPPHKASWSPFQFAVFPVQRVSCCWRKCSSKEDILTLVSWQWIWIFERANFSAESFNRVAGISRYLWGSSLSFQEILEINEAFSTFLLSPLYFTASQRNLRYWESLPTTVSPVGRGPLTVFLK